MTFAAPDPVPSGKPFTVVTVNGRSPRSLEDFVGSAVFSFRWLGQERRVAGQGSVDGETVHFQEKDVAHDGKDVRVWTIDRKAPGDFTAHTST